MLDQNVRKTREGRLGGIPIRRDERSGASLAYWKGLQVYSVEKVEAQAKLEVMGKSYVV